MKENRFVIMSLDQGKMALYQRQVGMAGNPFQDTRKLKAKEPGASCALTSQWMMLHCWY